MRILINDLEYRFLNDYCITEQAGATSVMSVAIKLDDKREPQPFDIATIEEDKQAESDHDMLIGGDVQDNVEVINGTLDLERENYATYESVLTNQENVTYGDLIND